MTTTVIIDTNVLVALVGREMGIPFIVSFDSDFDSVAWLTRMADASGVLGARR